MKRCYVLEYNKYVGYEEGLVLQYDALDLVRQNQMDGIILLLQHKPVITIGKNGGKEHLLASKESLDKLGIELYETRRGGNITYHGPGQLTAYPILNLKKFEKDIHWYVRQLEEVVIEVLKTYEITAGRKRQYTGVWVENRKIAAIGVHVTRWITMHGFAFNFSVNKEHFGLINPCGITEFGIVSLDDYLKKVAYGDVTNRVKDSFSKVFDTALINSTMEILLCNKDIE